MYILFKNSFATMGLCGCKGIVSGAEGKGKGEGGAGMSRKHTFKFED